MKNKGQIIMEPAAEVKNTPGNIETVRVALASSPTLSVRRYALAGQFSFNKTVQQHILVYPTAYLRTTIGKNGSEGPLHSKPPYLTPPTISSTWCFVDTLHSVAGMASISGRQLQEEQEFNQTYYNESVAVPNNCPWNTLTPAASLTRWGTLLDAVNYYAEHYGKIMEVIDALDSTDSSAVAAVIIDSNFKIVSV
ncbi:hypothetical protein ANN_04356 [Periplaneta americana]|uniref:Uncharacterized protein n=1 Tax=Periplaneta americana TaxID=6978 RepID=A0ABQ8T8B9_PERAM|nr:hypothetical protein ANN_04356 [Periplaneta americana]